MAIPEADRHGARARPPVRPRVPLWQLLRVALVACGIQFGWALQLSLLMPYVQELGIPQLMVEIARLRVRVRSQTRHQPMAQISRLRVRVNEDLVVG
uniref:Uncharacterized protein n=1 Tax=Fagus sylvatica TaxID=28930 RepID=A0A2N9HC78_FAGSY